jgi:protein MAK11
VWDPEGEEFAVAFERGAVVFGIDCKPKAHVIPAPRTKIHQMHYLPTKKSTILALSTEDGRIIFYDTSAVANTETEAKNGKEDAEKLPCALIAQLGGPAVGILGRVKDFEIIPIPNSGYLIIAGSSDGSVRLWFLSSAEISTEPPHPVASENGAAENAGSGYTTKQVGKLIGSYSTGARITCLKAFVMTGRAEEAADEEEEGKNSESTSDEESE